MKYRWIQRTTLWWLTTVAWVWTKVNQGLTPQEERGRKLILKARVNRIVSYTLQQWWLFWEGLFEGNVIKQGCSQGAGQGWVISILNWGKSLFSNLIFIGSTQFLASCQTEGLSFLLAISWRPSQSLVNCWPEAVHNFQPCGPPNMVSYFIKATRREAPNKKSITTVCK